MNIDLSRRLLGAAASVALAVSPALAQDDQLDELERSDARAENGEDGALPVVYVYGEKIPRTQFDTFSSVGVITADDIAERSLESLADIYNQLANVSSSFGGEGFSIRGISNGSITGGGDGPLATIYIDGATVNATGVRFGQSDTWDLAQVEVFRGAQSTNQGRNTLAGAVILRTQDPLYEYEIKGRARYAEFDSYVFSGAINAPVIDDVLAARFSFDIKNSDGFINNVTLDDDRYNKAEQRLFRGKILFEPTDNFSNILTVSLSENERGDDFVTDDDPFARISESNILGRRNLDQIIATWEADYAVTDEISLRNVFSFNNTELDRLNDDDRTAGGDESARATLNDTDTISEELRVHYDSERVQGFVGFYYFEEDGTNQRSIITDISIPEELPPPLAPFGPLIAPFYADPFRLSSVADTEEKTENYAFFVNVDFDLSSLVTLHAGLRYDHEEKDNVGMNVGSLGSPLPDPASAPAPLRALIAGINGLLIGAVDEESLDFDASYDAWLPQAGVTFNWSDTFKTSLLAKRSYRAGGASPTLFLGLVPFDPEFAWTYEASMRARLFDERVTVNANVFYMDWNDMQVLVDDGLDFFVINAAGSELKGFELEISARPSENLSLFANAGFVDSEFTSFDTDLTIVTGDLTGNEFTNSPNWTLSAGGIWRHDIGVFVQADVNYQGSSFGNAANTLVLDSRTIVNARIGYEAERFTVFFFARNAFDEEYIVQARTDGTVKVGEPQVFGGEIRVNW